jgi:hypothetical protein
MFGAGRRGSRAGGGCQMNAMNAVVTGWIGQARMERGRVARSQHGRGERKTLGW